MNKTSVFGLVLCFAVLINAHAADREWSWSWPDFSGPEPMAEVCALKYDKRWVYSLDIDDSPVSTYTISLPVLAEYHYTDAPPGVEGGNRKPFVGNAALFALRMNPSGENYHIYMLSWEQVREMCEAGWGVANHSYSHAAYDLSEDQLRNEIYWNQVLIGWFTPNRRATTYFVYPSGDTAYRPYLAEYGLLAGGIQGGPMTNIYRANLDWTDLKRIYLDEPRWASIGDPYFDFPDPLLDGDVVLDFAHGMEPEPDHPNRIRWAQRLEMIESLYGEGGADDVWSAPINEVVAYDIARRTAEVNVSGNHLTLFVDEDVPSSPITLKITGIPESVELIAPEGGLLYRQGNVVWVTTPSLGGPVGSALPTPNLRCIYNGPVEDIDWSEDIELGGVRIHQFGGEADETITVEIVEPDGDRLEIGSSTGYLPASWILISSVPNSDPWEAKGLRLSGVTSAHKRMEVWAIDPIDAWRKKYFNQVEPSGDAGDYADPDRDSHINFEEYAFCTDPNSGSSLPIVRPIPWSEDKGFGIEIDCRSGLVAPVYLPEYSDDLAEWSVGGTLDGAPFENGDGTLTARFMAPLIDNCFLRVSAK
ncbi:polysaccharide deacetylase family protein [Cerasicoccus arenae]|uniref:NodB homology domain-containing protein n=1 Tax=Cerasicoccus arenae TaxID=424488 RepID=A0A8J3GDW0_9BACT|nr:polysaccharide deacetylase family protein [Cerasicoccus arenae]MBK1858609.1 polysaccharide deacetylase family protein [Cerasicoccus arenae]GHC05023.1 hypothetical protein GCM10007047_22430 [Cerasicoccus arenae]